MPRATSSRFTLFATAKGRTARLLRNNHRLRHGDPHAIIPVEQRAAYLGALEDANAGNCEPIAAFSLGCVMDLIGKLIGEANN